LQERGLWERTGIVLAGDHGEAFGEHGEQQHGFFVYDTTLRVPLLLKPPGHDAAAQRVAEPACLIDIAPTLLAWAGASERPAGPCVELLELARGARAPARALYAESLVPFFNHGAAPLACIRSGGWKYITAPEPELYALEQDPQEAVNQLSLQPARSAQLRALLDALHALDHVPPAIASPSGRMDAQMREGLAALGYVSPGEIDGGSVRSDPKRVLRALRCIEDGDRALGRLDYDQAQDAYRQALESDPRNWKATWKLGDLLIDTGDLRGAERVYRAALGRDASNLNVDLRLAGVVYDLGRPDEALALCDSVLSHRPGHLEARTMRAVALCSLGQRRQARVDLEAVLRDDPQNQLARMWLHRLFDADSTE
jgi:choline-sulfatase